jgi:hypothetical protein
MAAQRRHCGHPMTLWSSSPPPHQEPVMHTSRLLSRAFSVAMAAVITLGMLGGIDALSQPDLQAALQWAQQAAAARA